MQEEAAFVKARLQSDVGKSSYDTKMTVGKILEVFKDWKVFAGGLMYMSMLVPSYGYAYFSGQIVKGFGYDSAYPIVAVCSFSYLSFFRHPHPAPHRSTMGDCVRVLSRDGIPFGPASSSVALQRWTCADGACRVCCVDDIPNERQRPLRLLVCGCDWCVC
jgi:hypothetical protein